jgi:putative spermidine/putrescine transport system permease protein
MWVSAGGNRRDGRRCAGGDPGVTRWCVAGLRFKGWIYALMLSPLIVPIIITAIGLYFFFVRIVGTGSIVAMGLGHAVLSIPVMTIILTASLQGIDENLDDAAYGLGAGRFYTLRRVTLPLVAPGVVAAFLFAFLMSLDELLIPLFLSGITMQTLSVRIWQSIQYELSPAIAAVSSILIALTLTVMALTALVRRRTRRRPALGELEVVGHGLTWIGAIDGVADDGVAKAKPSHA